MLIKVDGHKTTLSATHCEGIVGGINALEWQTVVVLCSARCCGGVVVVSSYKPTMMKS